MVNKVAHIVHSNTIKLAGEPNKNIGDAFLLIWRLSTNNNKESTFSNKRKSIMLESKVVQDQESSIHEVNEEALSLN